MEFRKLRSDEIEVRAQSVKPNGCSLLLYKDARCDMNILDETVGSENWQRKHTRDNKNCIVSIWCDTKKMWIEKEDTGTESNTEQEKGLASDSFKRACFNWGIGRELYTSPFIWVNLEPSDIKEYNGKMQLKTKFHVSMIEYKDNRIVALEISDTKSVRYKMGCYSKPKPEPKKKIEEYNQDIAMLAEDSDIQVVIEYCVNNGKISKGQDLTHLSDDEKVTLVDNYKKIVKQIKGGE